MNKKVEFKEKEYMEIYEIFLRITKLDNITSLEVFKRNLDKFIEITFDAYISNIGSKDIAFMKWVQFIGSRDLASDYFKAVDSWNAYT
ncbi:MAG: hypothetical protein JSV62_07650 [Promethearchaeota archaeon]|nr:MAG: hypothetical protein JSV62_07650 [Candidatus Lokiarchaeota archaeon]